jgi:hypothetical protein
MWTKPDSCGMKTRVSTVSVFLMLTTPEYKIKHKNITSVISESSSMELSRVHILHNNEITKTALL